MKVYYISAGYDSCYYVRCMLPLQAGGWWGDISTLRGLKNSPQEASKGVSSADVVVFQRPMLPDHLQMIKTLKEAGKTVVFDNDDTYVPDSGIPKIMNHIPELEDKVDIMLEKFDNNLKEAARMCDLVTVTTEFLAEEYRSVNQNVVVLPNCVNPEDWEEPLINETDKVRIALSGSVASSHDYEYAKEAILKLASMPNVQLILFGLPPDTPEFAEQRNFFKEDIDWWVGIGAEWYGWTGIEDYQDFLNELRIDINLIPRLDSYFNRCKSNLKYLEHSMYKIPSICQGFTTGDSPYQKDIVHGVNGMIAITPEDWINMTLELVNDPQKRKEIGQNAYDYVVENYNINNRITEWETAYTNVWKKEN
jgi:O-antigen biosynthesis protein